VGLTNDDIRFSYPLSLAPGETKIVMHFASQNATQAAAIAKAPDIQSLRLGALEGMSPTELGQVVNFATNDSADFYSIEVQAGDMIDVRTLTPADGLPGATGLLHPVLSLYDPTGGLIAVDGDGAADGRNAHLRMAAPVSGRYFVNVGSSQGEGIYVLRAMTLGTPGVVARQIFYNNSVFDATAGPSASDDLAIAIDKQALLPGETASFANYTSYSRGINGLLIDLAALPGNALTAGDFTFKVGNSDDPQTWVDAPAPASITVRGGAGRAGADRVTLIWPDRAIQKQWLQVTVLANAHTGLTAPDVFYFGNAMGDSGFNNPQGYATVTSIDQLGPRNNPRNMFPESDQAAITFPYDYNRDKRVSAADQLIARINRTTFVDALRLITAPAVPPAAVTSLPRLVPSALSESRSAPPLLKPVALDAGVRADAVGSRAPGFDPSLKNADRSALEVAFADYRRGDRGNDGPTVEEDCLTLMASRRPLAGAV
jgi:hypothetical protein